MTSFTPGRPPIFVLTKRTRKNVRQSKHGCLTCRARKVKCDETKPTCWRCHQSSKHCEGYTVRAASAHGHNTLSTDVAIQHQASSLIDIMHPIFSRGLSNKLYASNQDANYSRLGIEVLLQQRHEEAQWDNQPSWVQLIAQLMPANDAVSSAIITLGATYEAQCLQLSGSQPQHSLTHYQKALAALQREIVHLSQGHVPIFLASILLAAVEVLQRRLINATTHLQGAFKALTSLKPNIQPYTVYAERPGRIVDDLYSFAQSLDLQTAWYALGNPPLLQQSFDPTDAFDPTGGLLEHEAGVRSLLHGCYHFTSEAAKFKYYRHIKTPPSLVLEQSHYIAALSGWLAASSRSTRTSNGSVSPESLVLRAQVLSTLIYVSTILSAYEATYDLYAVHFQQILDIAGEVLAATKKTAPTSLPRFQFQPGMFQAIFLTAMKCRDPQLRRRAVNLCRHVGTEGPWDPRVMIPVAQRAIEVEEMDLLSDPVDGRMHLLIPETQRLHGCGMESSASEGNLSTHVQATFSLCKSVEHMLQSDDHGDPEHWIIWTEQLGITGYSKLPFR